MPETLLHIALRVLSCCINGEQPDPRDVITLRLRTPYPDSNLPTEELASLVIKQEARATQNAG